MTTHPLRLVQVGIGGWGRDWATKVVPQIPEVVAVGYVDADPAAARALAGAVPGFDTLAEAIAATGPDAVLITAAVGAHVPVAMEAVSAGLPVLVEKPLAETVEQARELIELAERRRVPVMVSQNYRFFPAPRAVAGLLAAGTLGPIQEINIDFRQYSGDRPSSNHGYAEPLFSDMAIHHFDLLRFLTGREVERVYAESWNPPGSPFIGPPVGMATLMLAGDVGVSYRGSWRSRGEPTPWAGHWSITCADGEIFFTSRLNDRVDGDQVLVRDADGQHAVELAGLKRYDRWGTLGEFATAVRDGRTPQSSAAENLGSLAVAAAAIESARTRQVLAPEH